MKKLEGSLAQKEQFQYGYGMESFETVSYSPAAAI